MEVTLGRGCGRGTMPEKGVQVDAATAERGSSSAVTTRSASVRGCMQRRMAAPACTRGMGALAGAVSVQNGACRAHAGVAAFTADKMQGADDQGRCGAGCGRWLALGRWRSHGK
jgi:hypothetical protein